MIPESFIEELKYRTDIEQIVSPYTTLKRTGRTLTGLCPFHSEKSSSFVVYPENGSFYCFGCGAGGDVVTFVRRAEHLEYVEAIRFLAQKAGMPLPQDVENDQTAKQRMRVLEVNREAARYFHSVLTSPEGRPGLDYFRERQLTPRTIRRFGLGYAPDSWNSLRDALTKKGFSEADLRMAAVVREGKNGGSYDLFRGRVIFPIIDLRGGVIGFGGRILGEGQPKYLNSPDTAVFKKSRGLFAMNFAKATKEPRLILAEGYMDAIAIHQAGFDNAVATLGTALTADQARLIAQYASEVVIAYDSDAPGQKATRRASELFSKTGVKVRVLSMQGAKDPDEYLKTQGAIRFRQLVEGSANATEFEIAGLKARYDLETDDGKVGFMKEFSALLARMPNRVEADVYLTRLSAEVGVSWEALSEEVKALRRKILREKEKKYDSTLKIFTQERPNAPRDPQRLQDPRCALAEDKLLVLLLKNPDAYPQIRARIAPAQFVTETNRTIYGILCDRLDQGKSIDLMELSSALSVEEMGWLSGLLASNREQGFIPRELSDYIDVICAKAQERTNEQVGSMEGVELKEFISGIVAKKK